MRQQHFNTGKTTLTSDQLRAVAPSVFAERPYHAVSERYRFIPTSAVLDRLMSNGWEVKQAMEQRVRLVDKRGFTKHRVVLEQAGAADQQDWRRHAAHPVDRHHDRCATRTLANSAWCAARFDCRDRKNQGRRGGSHAAGGNTDPCVVGNHAVVTTRYIVVSGRETARSPARDLLRRPYGVLHPC